MAQHPLCIARIPHVRTSERAAGRAVAVVRHPLRVLLRFRSRAIAAQRARLRACLFAPAQQPVLRVVHARAAADPRAVLAPASLVRFFALVRVILLFLRLTACFIFAAKSVQNDRSSLVVKMAFTTSFPFFIIVPFATRVTTYVTTGPFDDRISENGTIKT